MAGVSVTIGANTDQLDSAVKHSKSQMGQLNKEFKQVALQAAKFGAAAAAAGAAMAVGLTVKGLAAVDAQAKLARQLGASIDGLRATQIAASDAGISMGVMQSAAERLNQRIGEAQRGTGAAAESFKRLGLDASALGQMDVDQRMATIADRMQGLGLSTSQAADELRQMGIRNGEMVNLMLQGGDAIRNARGEVDALGLSLSSVDAAQVEVANDAFARFGLLLEGVQQQLAVQVAPLLTAVSRLLVDSAEDAGGLGNATADAFNLIIDGGAEAVNAVASMDRQFLRTQAALDVFALEVRNGFLEIAREIVEIPTGAVNELIGALNSMGADIELLGLSDMGRGVQNVIDGTRQEIMQINEDLAEEMAKPLPGDKFKRFVFEAREAAERAAIELQSVDVPDVGGAGGDGEGGDGEGGDKDALEKLAKWEEEKAKLKREKMMEAFEQEFMLTEEFNFRMAELRDLKEDSDTVSEQDYQNARLDRMRQFFSDQYGISSSGFDALGDLAASHWNAETAMAVDAFGHILNALSGNSRKVFEIQKAAGIANAVVSTYTGASKALELGWPLGPIAAASITAKGFANVAKIKSQSFGGGSSGGSAGAGASNTAQLNQAAQPVQQREQTVANISLQGDTFGRETVKSLMEQMNELADDGMRYNIV